MQMTEFQESLPSAGANTRDCFQPRDRIHNICNELMSTEEAYVKRLAILVMVSVYDILQCTGSRRSSKHNVYGNNKMNVTPGYAKDSIFQNTVNWLGRMEGRYKNP